MSIAHVQVDINCRYCIAQMCTSEDMLSHYLGVPYLDDVMSQNELTTRFFFCFYCRMSSPAFMLVNNDGQDFPEIYQKKGDLGKVSPLRYDRIVCDVPCSGKWH